jgi:serine phosphatase RsbU (regulator of sigma subunit)
LLQISTAGHLPPYRNGEEVPLPGALPLGMLPGATYETVRYHLACGDRLVFLSDGVVEARSQTGALLGFESSRALTNLPAAEIADAAVRFGQEDDITVVTVAFCPVMAPAETA